MGRINRFLLCIIRAQQRFRERQKEKSQQTVQHAEQLEKQVEQLQARARAAEERCMVMERLLSMKDSERSTPTEPVRAPCLPLLFPVSPC